MRRVASWLAALAVALLGWLQPATAQAFAAPQPVPVYTYDSPIWDAPQDDTVSERGPPTNYGYTHQHAADDLVSHGAFERSDVADHGATTTYSSNAEVAQATVASTTTSRSAQVRSGELSSHSVAMVAANTGSRLAEVSSSAFRAADNVGDFTVSAKHLPGAGGRWNKWGEGVDINGTIANALRSDAATFLPNAGGVADSFIVRTNVGSVIGTKGQTYVKAVISNDGRIITAYPVK